MKKKTPAYYIWLEERQLMNSSHHDKERSILEVLFHLLTE